MKDSKEPVKIGFHSPTSAPKIVLEGALVKAGLKVTLDPSDSKADVLLVDLKETSNLLASLTAGQVEAVVGPSPFPEVAQTRGIGKVLVNLGELPPAGQWANFPCCVGVASEEMIAKHPEVVRAFVALISPARGPGAMPIPSRPVRSPPSGSVCRPRPGASPALCSWEASMTAGCAARIPICVSWTA